jgi:protein TonB
MDQDSGFRPGSPKGQFIIDKVEIIPPKVKILSSCGDATKEYYEDIVHTEAIDISSLENNTEVEAKLERGAACIEFAEEYKNRKVKVKIFLKKGEGVINDAEPLRCIGEIRPPTLMKRVEPIMPKAAIDAKISGIVLLEVTTDGSGNVKDIKILRSIPLLDNAAIEAVRQWKYEPFSQGGRKRGLIFTVTVRFK